MCGGQDRAGVKRPARPVAASAGHESVVLHGYVPRKIELLFFVTTDQSGIHKQAGLLWKTTIVSIKQRWIWEIYGRGNCGAWGTQFASRMAPADTIHVVTPANAGAHAERAETRRGLLARIAQPRRHPIDRQMNAPVHPLIDLFRWIEPQRPVPPDQLHLQVIQRIQIRKPVLDRPRQ